MLFSVNKNIMQILKDSKWSPTTPAALEEVLNIKLPYVSFSTYLDVIKTWNNEILNASRIKASTFLLMDIARNLHLYFENLLNSFESLDRLSNFCHVSKIKSTRFAILQAIDKMKVYDEKLLDDDFNVNLDALFNDLKFAYDLISNKDFEFKLKESLTTEEVVALYRDLLSCNLSLYDFIVDIQKQIYAFYGPKWKDNVFNPKNLRRERMHLEAPQNFIVSFCDDIARYDSSSQRIISACLYNTGMSNTYQNRDFGFLYDFSQDDILAMSFKDVYSFTSQIGNWHNLLGVLFQGIPMNDLTRVVQMYVWNLKPIYDYDEFCNRTYEYNEIVLKDTAEPYGILVKEEALPKVFPEVFSLVIVKQLPLFVKNLDGNVDVIPYNEVYNSVRNKFTPLGVGNM